MKTTLQLFGTILIAFLISCSSSTSPDSDFQSRVVGSFKVTSPNALKWIGNGEQNYTNFDKEKTKVKDVGVPVHSDVDSVIYNQPDNNNLVGHWYCCKNNEVYFIYTDSTFSRQYFEEKNGFWGFHKEDYTFGRWEYSLVEPEYLQIGFYLNFDCDSTYTDANEMFTFRAVSAEDSISTVIQVEADKLYDASREIVDCQQQL